MQLWSRGIPGGLVDAVSWPVVCNHSPTSHFVKGIHHWRQKSNLQAAMSIWAIGFKWAIPRKCHAFLGLGVFKTTVLVGEYFLNLFTSFGSSNWSRKHILRHIGILYHVFVHDGMIYLYSSPEPFSTLFSLHARVFSSMNCNIRNVLKPNPSLFLILTYHYSCHLETPNQPISSKPWMPKDPRPWKKSTNSRAFQWRWSSRFPRRTGLRVKLPVPAEGPTLRWLQVALVNLPSAADATLLLSKLKVWLVCHAKGFVVCCWWFDNEKIGDK